MSRSQKRGRKAALRKRGDGKPRDITGIPPAVGMPTAREEGLAPIDYALGMPGLTNLKAGVADEQPGRSHVEAMAASLRRRDEEIAAVRDTPEGRIAQRIHASEPGLLQVDDEFEEDSEWVVREHLGEAKAQEFRRLMDVARSYADDDQPVDLNPEGVAAFNLMIEALGVSKEKRQRHQTELDEQNRAEIERRIGPEIDALRARDPDTPPVRFETGERGEVQVLIGNPGELGDRFSIKDVPPRDPWEDLVLTAVEGKIDSQEFARKVADNIGGDAEKMLELRRAIEMVGGTGDARVRALMSDALRYALADAEEIDATLAENAERTAELRRQIAGLRLVQDPLWQFRRSERLALSVLGVL